MKRKKSEQVQVVDDSVIGPEPDGIRYCLKCHKDYRCEGEHLAHDRAPWGVLCGLAVGVHDCGCYDTVQVSEQVTP